MGRQLTFKQRILAAATLFGMFFGPASLIFPVHLGQLAGSNVTSAAIGFIVTAVGIPILGVAAIAITHANGLQALANHIDKGYSYFFTCLLYLAIGPFFAIPRCATISFTTGIVPMLGGNSETSALLIFSAVLYAIVLFCSLHRSGIKVWIGKIITPLLLLFFAILVIAALLKPSTSISTVAPVDAYKTGALFLGFVEGYNTMDGIAGLAFGIVVVDLFRGMGIGKDTAITKAVLYSGSLAGALMFLYPLTITLILLALFGKFFDHDKAVYISVTAFTGTAALVDLLKTLPAALQNALHLDGILALAPQIFPLFSMNLGWILPAVIGFVIGLSIHILHKHRSS